MAKSRRSDPVEQWKEIQDHRYDPGHWTGGKIDPLIRARRPNKYGWLLLVPGLFSVAMGAAVVRDSDTSSVVVAVLPLLFGAIFIAAGIQMLWPRNAAPKR